MKIFPYIQEQYSDFSPLLEPIGGYAFFVDIFEIQGAVEGVFETSGSKVLLDDIVERDGAITLGQKGESRSKTAVCGELTNGNYIFNLKFETFEESYQVSFERSALESPKIKVVKTENGVQVEWESEGATCYWIFAVPEKSYSSYTELFKELWPISENGYLYPKLNIKENPFGENIQYRVIVRANIKEKLNGVYRYSKETWGISSVID